jgi:hypothetical protein
MQQITRFFMALATVTATVFGVSSSFDTLHSYSTSRNPFQDSKKSFSLIWIQESAGAAAGVSNDDATGAASAAGQALVVDYWILAPFIMSEIANTVSESGLQVWGDDMKSSSSSSFPKNLLDLNSSSNSQMEFAFKALQTSRLTLKIQQLMEDFDEDQVNVYLVPESIWNEYKESLLLTPPLVGGGGGDGVERRDFNSNKASSSLPNTPNCPATLNDCAK